MALGAVLEGLTSGIALLNQVYDQLRFWQAGIAGYSQPANVESRARTRGYRWDRGAISEPCAEQPEPRQRYRDGAGGKWRAPSISGLLAITVLCGSATALVGLSPFIGLMMMPHMARWLVGADTAGHTSDATGNPCSAAFADVWSSVGAGRTPRPSVVSAFIGAPVLIFLVRRKIERKAACDVSFSRRLIVSCLLLAAGCFADDLWSLQSGAVPLGPGELLPRCWATRRVTSPLS